MKNERLYCYWNKALQNLSIPSDKLNDADALFKDIVHHYSKKKRYYHNLVHVNTLLELIGEQDLSSTDQAILILTAFMHDVIYEPERGDNEFKSAIYSSENLNALGLEKKHIKTIHSIIIATQNHVSDDDLCQLFLDMDLAILGEDHIIYEEYIHNIRKEFSSVPLSIYHSGRSEFIKKTLAKPSIYTTSYFKDNLEIYARVNLKTELELIKNYQPKIQLPYKKIINQAIIGIFGVPLLIFLYDLVIKQSKLELASNGVQFFLLPAIIISCFHLPIFRFKRDKKAIEKQALIKIPIIEFYIWFAVLLGFFMLFLGTITILDPSSISKPSFLLWGVAITFLSFLILNSNSILFKGDYQTKKDKLEWERKQTTLGDFSYSDEGFSFKTDKINFETKWIEIEGIIAYKTDSFAYDTIHLRIKKIDTVELDITEETDGWFQFKEQMNNNLTLIDEFWEMKVIFPAFEECATLVYEKK